MVKFPFNKEKVQNMENKIIPLSSTTVGDEAQNHILLRAEARRRERDLLLRGAGKGRRRTNGVRRDSGIAGCSKLRIFRTDLVACEPFFWTYRRYCSTDNASSSVPFANSPTNSPAETPSVSPHLQHRFRLSSRLQRQGQVLRRKHLTRYLLRARRSLRQSFH